jgi:hypothetical protein
MFFKITNLWSIICLVFLFTFVAGVFTSCGNEAEISNPQQEQDTEGGQLSKKEFFDQNVAFADARVRSISQTEYVREIVLMNFSKENRMPKSVIFAGTTFFDDGSYNDLKANDGIYASAAKFSHCDRVPYDKRLIIG